MSNSKAAARRLSLVVALVAGTAGIIGLPVTVGKTAAYADAAPDNRTVILLNAAERNYVLENMREHLGDVQGVIEALAAGDSAAALRSATALGTLANKQNTKRPAGMVTKFSKEFMTATQEFHKEFDGIADGMAHGDTATQSLRRVADAMRSCVACHASYQIEVSRP